MASIRAGRGEPAQGHLFVRGLISLQKEKGRGCQVTYGGTEAEGQEVEGEEERGQKENQEEREASAL